MDDVERYERDARMLYALLASACPNISPTGERSYTILAHCARFEFVANPNGDGTYNVAKMVGA